VATFLEEQKLLLNKEIVIVYKSFDMLHNFPLTLVSL
jgi:hypothetical protein